MSGSPPALSLLVRHFLLLVMTSSLLYAEATAEKSCGTTVHSANRITSRIVNGDKADISSNPWMVQVSMMVNETHLSRCGGSIINPEYVLTAAHCMFKKVKGIHYRIPDSSVGVVTGKCDWSYYTKPVEEVFVHQDYNPARSEVKNDIALIRLKYPLKLDQSPKENSICLPGKDVTVGDLSSLTCKTTGWGSTQTGGLSPWLMGVSLDIATQKTCSNYIKIYGQAVWWDVHKLSLCASAPPNKGTCGGDSGGPLVCQYKGDDSWFVAGINSFGAGCALEGHYDVFVDVVKYLDWIDNITKGKISEA